MPILGKHVTEILLFSFLLILLLGQILDPDIWFHLSIGREIFNTQAIPQEEFLVYPNAGKPGSFHEWGFGLMHYVTYLHGGYWGMSLLNSLMASLTLVFLYKAARPTRSQEAVFVIVLIAVLSWMQFRLAYRPEMVLYLALAIEFMLLERFLETRNRRYLMPIPIMGFLLSQAHPSALFLVLILGIYAIQLIWDSKKDFRLAFTDVGLYTAASFIGAIVRCIVEIPACCIAIPYFLSRATKSSITLQSMFEKFGGALKYVLIMIALNFYLTFLDVLFSWLIVYPTGIYTAFAAW